MAENENKHLELNGDSAPLIVRRAGGWFVTGVEWSGPWRNMEAAELARDGEYVLAHAENRKPHP